MRYLKKYEDIKSELNGNTKWATNNKTDSETSIDLEYIISQFEDLNFDDQWIGDYLRKMLIGKNVEFSCQDCPDEFDNIIHKAKITSLKMERDYDESPSIIVEISPECGGRDEHKMEIVSKGIVVHNYKEIEDPEIQKRLNQQKFDL